ncbi:MAG TPA: tetraacyldisaccharide 4'-kinase [Kiloniellaceae bacterium]|nr:tetraacyldisaccharide 4'-kinase [Kiloniellaceae bacterium]
MRAPDFWERDNGLARALQPLATGYRLLDHWNRGRVKARKVAAPVICVGNLVAGGAGKTPVTLSLMARLQAQGRKPATIIRGYGGRLKGPLAVDPARHDAAAVGDEALLLAAAGRTWLAADRVAGATAALADGADVVVLDDGFQNPGLAKDLSLVTVDGSYGFGNGRLLPAGPLRESVEAGLARAQAMVILGRDRCGLAARYEGRLPLLQASIRPMGDLALQGRRLVAFAGIGRPEKFFETLRQAGAELVECLGFPDHHPYRPDEITAILARATRASARPITTAKDAVRLPPEARAEIEVLPVEVVWQDDGRLDRLLEGVLHG